MTQGTKSELKSTDQAGLARHVSTLGPIIRAWLSRVASLVSKRATRNAAWLKAEEKYSRATRNRYEIYTENIGSVGLKNIEILLDRRKEWLPGSALNVGLIGRDKGIPEASLKIEIVTNDEETVLELAAEIRRYNGQSWVGIYVTAGTFIEISGPKELISELRDPTTSDNAGDGRADQMRHELSDLESTSRMVDPCIDRSDGVTPRSAPQ